jgi:hypothetical protein
MLLFKFGEPGHLRALQAGSMHLSSWGYFKNCENVAERDVDEGTHEWRNPEISSIIIAGRRLTATGGTLSFSLSYPDSQTKIFCASELRSDRTRVTGPLFDPRLLKHGSQLLVITDVAQFVRQLEPVIKTLYDQGIIECAKTGFVTYFDKNKYDGEVGPFRKTSDFAHEKEWRFVLRTTAMDDKPFALEIGSIAGISTLMETKDFKNQVIRRDDGSIHIAI